MNARNPMRRVAVLLLGISLLCTGTAHAFSPAFATLDERVEHASHIFIGKITAAKLERVESSTLNPGLVTYTVSVENVFFPSGWHSDSPLKISGLNGMEYAGKEILGNSYIFIVKAPEDPRSDVFVASAGSGVKEPVEKKDEVIRSLYKRLYKQAGVSPPIGRTSS